jgi:hypothetical protein
MEIKMISVHNGSDHRLNLVEKSKRWRRCTRFLRGTIRAIAIFGFVTLMVSNGLVRCRASEQGRASTTSAFERCIDGTASSEDAFEVGKILGERFYDLRFDSSILSTSCVDQINVSLFGKYDDNLSLKLASFFWDTASLRSLLAKSRTASHLTCDITCLLAMDRRPLSDFSLFHDLVSGELRHSTASIEFLLARSLITKAGGTPGQIDELIGSVGGNISKEQIIKNLFVLASVEFAKTLFEFKRNQLCLLDRCIDVADVNLGDDCGKMTKSFLAPRDLDDAIGLKTWMMGGGRRAVYACTDAALRGPVGEIQSSLLRGEFDLSAFDPALNLIDVVSAFRSGVFVKTDFLDEDILTLQNLNLTKVQSASWNFVEEIVSQMENEQRKKSQPLLVSANAKALFSQTTSSSRLAVVLCRSEHASSNSDGSACEARKIYMSAITAIIR